MTESQKAVMRIKDMDPEEHLTNLLDCCWIRNPNLCSDQRFYRLQLMLWAAVTARAEIHFKLLYNAVQTIYNKWALSERDTSLFVVFSLHLHCGRFFEIQCWLHYLTESSSFFCQRCLDWLQTHSKHRSGEHTAGYEHRAGSMDSAVEETYYYRIN